jgi:hypothetical protein
MRAFLLLAKLTTVIQGGAEVLAGKIPRADSISPSEQRSLM